MASSPVPVWLAYRLFAHLHDIRVETEGLIAGEHAALCRLNEGVLILRNLLDALLEQKRKKEEHLKLLQEKLRRIEHEVANLRLHVAGSGVITDFAYTAPQGS